MVGRIEEVLGILEGAGVRYLVVGGVAAVLHGHLRTTAVLGLADLIEMKRRSGRPRDLEDVAALEAIARLEEGRGRGT